MKKPPQKKQAAIQYAIVPRDLAGHMFDVTLTVAAPSPEGQVLALEGDHGARGLLKRHPVTEVAVDDPGIFKDIDQPSDL